MNNLNNSVDDVVECPLCMEPFEVDDLNFYPCTCGYQICRFCWHRIRTDENELCPACRKEYPENPADFKPLTQEEMVAFKSQKRQRDQQRKQKITENRKHLANVRVVQKNLVFVVGLPPRLADADILKKHEYFGKYGKIHKVVINPSTTYAGVQGPSASAYVTYVHNTDALRAIQSVNNIMIDGRLIKTSLGTTKYCSHFMKNQQCPKGDCMYLHELGDPEASFTKEEMHQGKHQEYEKRLHDFLIATSGASAVGGIVTTGSTSSLSSNCKIVDNSKLTAILPSTSSSTIISSSLTSTTSNATSSTVSTTGQQREAWPSLSISPVNQKDSTVNSGVSSNKCKKERIKQDKNKNVKNKKNNTSINNTNLITLSKEVSDSALEEIESTLTLAVDSSSNNAIVEQTTKSKADKSKERNQNSLSNRSSQRKEDLSSAFKENEIKMSTTSTLDLENKNGPHSNKIKNDHSTKSDGQRSLSSSSNSSSSCLMATSDNNSPINESVSGKSSPNSFYVNRLLDERTKSPVKSKKTLSPRSELECISDHNIGNNVFSETSSKPYEYLENSVTSDKNLIQTAIQNYDDNMETALCNAEDENRLKTNNLEQAILSETSVGENKNENILADTLSKLNLFDENSFFSSTHGVLQQTIQLKNKHNEDTNPTQLNIGTMPNLPDLINGIDGYQNNANDWEEAFKNVMLKTNKEMEEKLQQHSLQQQLHHHNQIKHQEDLHRLQELQKRNTLLTSLNLSQLNGTQNEYLSNNYLTGSDLNRQSNFLQHQQHQLLQHQSSQNSNENILQNSLFGTNMSKFFDFHKNQQKQQQHCTQNVGSSNAIGGLNDGLHMMSLLDNNRLNPQLIDPNCTMSSQQQQQHQKQKIFGKMDQMLWHQQLQQPQPQAHSSVQSQQNQFLQNSNSDDDLGFDPFIETQKALAELIENEEEQQNIGSAGSSKLIPHKQINNQQVPHQHQVMDYMQRTRMPPPGFNHVNNFGGYGVPKLQSNSKMMPFMNLSNNYAGSTGQPIQQQPQLQIQSSTWNTHLGNFQQHSNDQQIRHVNSNQMQNGASQKGYSGNDWTAMDPAILSFRQFSFPQQTPIAPHLQPQQQDMFLQQFAQQHQQSGLNSQSQHISGSNVGVPNAMINSQQNSQAHVNANVQGMLEYLKTRQFV